MKKAFSLIELLVTLAIIGIVAAIIMNAYSGIQNSAIAVAQQKDQTELSQVLAELRISGGNLAAIIAADTTLTTPASTGQLGTEAAELTAFLQNPVTSASKTQKGTMGGQALPINDCIIPFPYATNLMADTRNRIIFSSGTPSISSTAGQYGFVVVNVNSGEYSTFMQSNSSAVTNWILSWSTLPANNVAGVLASRYQQAATSAQTSNPNGTKYAGHEAYVWDVDPTQQPGPGPGPGTGNGPTYSLRYVCAYSTPAPNYTASINGGSPTTIPTNLNAGTYTYADYVGQTITSTQSSTNTTYIFTPGNSKGAMIYIYAFLADSNGAPVDKAATFSQYIGTGNFGTPVANGKDVASCQPIAESSGITDTTSPLYSAYQALLTQAQSADPGATCVPGILFPIQMYDSGSNSGVKPQDWEAGSNSLAVTLPISSDNPPSTSVDASSPPTAMISASNIIPLDSPQFTIQAYDAHGAPVTVTNGDLTATDIASATITIAGDPKTAGTANDAAFSTQNYTPTGLDGDDGFSPDPTLSDTYDFTPTTGGG